MNLKTMLAIPLLAFPLVGAATSSAHAGGWFADTFIRPLNPGLADQADAMNRQLGKPFEHGVAALSNYIIPGSGVILEGVWTAQDVRDAWQNGELSDEDAFAALAELGESAG
jgi:hypothetical protein